MAVSLFNQMKLPPNFLGDQIMTTFFQASLSQGTARTHGYVEQRAAHVGAMVEILDSGFSGLWRVDSVADKGIEEKAMKESQRLQRSYMSRTDA